MDIMKSKHVLGDIYIKLSRIDKNINKIVNPKAWINISEAAVYSGLSISTIRRAVQRGSLKYTKKRGQVLFKRYDIDRWLDD